MADREWTCNTDELTEIEAWAKEHVRNSRNKAWEKFQAPIKQYVEDAVAMIRQIVINDMECMAIYKNWPTTSNRIKNHCAAMYCGAVSLAMEAAQNSPSIGEVKTFYKGLRDENKKMYSSHLYNEGPKSALRVEEIKPMVSFDAPTVNGYEILNKYFDALFAQNPKYMHSAKTWAISAM
jgi:hypothetical protein